MREYVARLSSNARILTLAEMTDEDIQYLPREWTEILAVSGAERILRALEYWGALKEVIPNTIAYMEKNLSQVEVVTERAPNKPSSAEDFVLIYELKSAAEGEHVYYEAQNPLGRQESDSARLLWGKLPAELVSIYDLHNGFYKLKMQDNGFMPVEFIYRLSDKEWGILDEIGAPPVDMEKTLAVYFLTSTASAVCLNFGGKELSALKWYHDSKPVLGLDFWNTIDTLFVTAMEDH